MTEIIGDVRSQTGSSSKTRRAKVPAFAVAAGNEPAPLPEPGAGSQPDMPVTRDTGFEMVLLSEPENHRWAERTAQSFRQQFADVPQVGIESLRCGNTFCRVELTTPEGQAGVRQVMDRLQHVKAIEGLMTLRVREQPSPPLAIIYFAKAGSPLPVLSPVEPGVVELAQ